MSSLVTLPKGELAAVDAWGHAVFLSAPETVETGALELAAGRQAIEAAHSRRTNELGVAYYRELLARRREDEELCKTWGLPANPRATPDAYKVLQSLAGLTDREDKRFLFAQDIWCYDEGAYDAGFSRFVAKLAEKTGKWLPMLHVSYPDSSVDTEKAPRFCADANRHAIAYWKAGGLVTIHTNPANPWTGKFETAHRERIANVLQAGTPENLAWTRSLDALSSHLAVLRDAGVVVLWRPLHEMTFVNCYWYDCGATPDREVFKDLWRYMFRYMTYEKGLDNLLWVYSVADVGSWNGPAPDCVYPGGDYVDVVGISLYGNSVRIDGGAYETLLALGKPFAFSEFGPGHHGGATGMKEDWAGRFDNMTLIRRVREQYPRAIWAAYWHSWPGADMAIVDNPGAEQAFSDPWVLSREDLNWRGQDVPELEQKRRHTVRHKEFVYPAASTR
jgi:mannan endo-1,4-beta-mannosidase